MNGRETLTGGWAGAVALVAAAALALFAVLFMDPAGSPPAGPLPEAAEINFAAPVTVEAEEPVGESVRWVWANRAALCREAEDVGRRQVVRVLLDVGRVESDVEVAYVRGVLAGCAAAP